MYKKSEGFTFVELVAVILILGIVAAIGSSFLITAVDAYRITEVRAKLVSRGRTAMEQMTRQLRLSAPNSARVSASGNCIEFMPLVGGGNYQGNLPDAENGAPTTNSIATSPFLLDLGSPQYVIVAALSANEIYTSASPSARAQLASTIGNPINTLNLAANHRFIRNSINKRVFVADNPKRFCLASSTLVQYNTYTFDTGTLSDVDPGGATVIMSFDVSAAGTAFVLSPGSEDRNTAVIISLAFIGNGERVELNQQVLVRNVP